MQACVICVAMQIVYKFARSVPENAGRDGLYKTVPASWW